MENDDADRMAGQSRRAIILTALGLEYRAVRKHLEQLREIEHPQGTVYERGVFTGQNGVTWEVILGEIGAGNVAAARETERATSHFNPDIVMFVGVAGGLKDVALGDVVVATKVYGYESGKAQVNFEPRPQVHQSRYRLWQRALAEARREDWKNRLRGGASSRVRVFVAPIAAGEKVVSSRGSALHKFLRQHYSDAVAVEMEGYGFLDAIAANDDIPALVVRGISDLIAGKRRADAGGSQERAARNASAFAFEFLSKFNPHNLNEEGPPSGGGMATPPSIGGDSDRNNREAALQRQWKDTIERLIADVMLGEWRKAEMAAIRLIEAAGPDAITEVFHVLLSYQDCPDEELLWRALQTWEMMVQLAPWLIDHDTLRGMAEHRNFTVRASAASICMDLADFTPDRVPVDIVMKLSVFDEDWYVQAPANGALKAMASSMPAVLRIFFNRLESESPGEREHAAAALRDIGRREPGLLDPRELRTAIAQLRRNGDKTAAKLLTATLPRVKRARRIPRYKYGI